MPSTLLLLSHPANAQPTVLYFNQLLSASIFSARFIFNFPLLVPHHPLSTFEPSGSPPHFLTQIDAPQIFTSRLAFLAFVLCGPVRWWQAKKEKEKEKGPCLASARAGRVRVEEGADPPKSTSCLYEERLPS